MTKAQKRSVCELQARLAKYGGDSHADTPNVSPKGDGRWVSLWEVWGRGNRATAHRRNVAKAHASGELLAYEIAFVGGAVKACPVEEIAQQEADYYFNDPSLMPAVRAMRQKMGLPRKESNHGA